MEIEVQEPSVATAQLSFQVDPLMLFSHRVASQKDLNLRKWTQLTALLAEKAVMGKFQVISILFVQGGFNLWCVWLELKV